MSYYQSAHVKQGKQLSKLITKLMLVKHLLRTGALFRLLPFLMTQCLTLHAKCSQETTMIVGL